MMKKIFLSLLSILIVVLLLKSFQTKPAEKAVQETTIELTDDAEVDEIFSLLAYSIVHKYWQDHDRKGRGYNVGSVLVSPDNEILDWGINSVNQTENCTQHGEVRLMTKYLDKDGVYALNNHTIYSTLEPCAMCAGMMTMASIKRTVNGQRDYYFSKALERLAYDSEAHGGYPPYPRIVLSEETPSRFGAALDKAYQDYIEEGNRPIITKFLSKPSAKAIYAEALQAFQSFQVANSANQKIYQSARNFFDQLPEEPK